MTELSNYDQSPYLVKQYARKKLFSLIIGDKNWIFRNRQNTSQLGHHDVDISDSFVKTSSPLNVPGVPEASCFLDCTHIAYSYDTHEMDIGKWVRKFWTNQTNVRYIDHSNTVKNYFSPQGPAGSATPTYRYWNPSITRYLVLYTVPNLTL